MVTNCRADRFLEREAGRLFFVRIQMTENAY